MAEIGGGRGATGKTIAGGINGPFRVLEGGIPYVTPTETREEGAIAGETRGESAIKHIYTSRYAFEEIFRRTHAHEVARLLRREMGYRLLDNRVHKLLGLSHTEATDGIAWQVQRGKKSG